MQYVYGRLILKVLLIAFSGVIAFDIYQTVAIPVVGGLVVAMWACLSFALLLAISDDIAFIRMMRGTK